jgi:hypothetical protein
MGGEVLKVFAHEFLLPVLSQSLLPIIPEEELQAYAEELRYAKAKGLAAATALLQKEADEISDHISGTLRAHFPRGWFELSMQYYFLATSQQRK